MKVILIFMILSVPDEGYSNLYDFILNVPDEGYSNLYDFERTWWRLF